MISLILYIFINQYKLKQLQPGKVAFPMMMMMMMMMMMIMIMNCFCDMVDQQ